jgi:hypothetical protein
VVRSEGARPQWSNLRAGARARVLVEAGGGRIPIGALFWCFIFVIQNLKGICFFFQTEKTKSSLAE